MHCHLDFMANGEEVARDAERDGSLLFANTVTPAGYLAARERFDAFGNVRVGLGMHPWWVRTGEDGEQLVKLLDAQRFVGEVGLDFGKRNEATRTAQIEAFTAIARACATMGDKVLSIHSVRAAREVLDVLNATGALENCKCIFHWYSGPSDQLKRAIDAECLFSVNTRMLATGKGREYAKAIPLKQLLLETDAPPGQNEPYSWEAIRSELEDTAAQVAAIKGTSSLELVERTAHQTLS